MHSRRLLIGLALLLAAGSLAWTTFGRRSAGVSEYEARPRELASADGRLGEPGAAHAESPGHATREEAAPSAETDDIATHAAVVAAPVAVSDAPRARAFGRVIDVRGGGVAGTRVELELRELLEDASELSAQVAGGSGPLLQLSTRADGEGRFEFSLPLLDEVEAVLEFEGPAGFALFEARIAWQTGSERAPLVPGPCALGDFVLPAAARVHGRVFDEHGQPLAGVRVEVARATDTTEADGSYSIGRAPAGGHRLHARKQGYVEYGGWANAPAAAATRVDFALRAARTIAGSVLDPSGAPIAGALVLAASAEGTCYFQFEEVARALSAADGAFELALPDDRAFHVGAYRNPRVPRSGQVRELHFKNWPKVRVGTRDLRIELPNERRVWFRAYDVSSGAALERFGVCAVERPPLPELDAAAVPRVEHAPTGVLSLAWDSWCGWYHCEAPGYAPTVGSIRSRSSADRPQTIALERGARIAGSLVGGAHAQVVLSRHALTPDGTPAFGLAALVSNGPERPYDLSPHRGRARSQRCDARGRFEFSDLAAGTYCLVAHASGHAPTTIARISVAAGQALDVGAIEPRELAAIEGVLRLAPGHSPEGLLLRLGREQERIARVAADGRFEFRDLAAGEHRLRIDDDEERCTAVPPLKLSLESGERERVVWDLADRVPARLEVSVSESGSGLSGLHVAVRSSPNDVATSARDAITDERGIARVRVGARGSRIVTASTSHGVLLGWHVLHVPCLPGEQRRVELPLQTGSLSIRWTPDALPDAFFTDPLARVELQLFGQQVWGRVARFEAAPTDTGSSEALPLSPERAVDIERIAPGHWTLRATVHHSGSMRDTGSTQRTIEVRCGERTTVQF